MKPTLLIMIVAFSISVFGQSDRVVADKAQKIYWAFECVEARLVPLKDYVEFPTKAVAEQNGFSSAPKCSSPQAPSPVKSSPQTLKVRELSRKSASLTLIASEFSKYRFKTVRVIGYLSNSASDFLRYGGYGPQTFWEFSLSSLSDGSGYFYMRKTSIAEKLRNEVSDSSRKIADCQVRIEGVTGVGGVYGQLVNCTFWRYTDDGEDEIPK